MADVVKLTAAGTVLPYPSELSCADELLWSENAGRSPDSGKMLGDIVARKKTFDVTWNWLTRAQFTSLRAAVNGSAYFNLKVEIGSATEADITVYQGGISDEFGGIFGGVAYYKSVKISFVQR